jgi:hypothetical protein
VDQAGGEIDCDGQAGVMLLLLERNSVCPVPAVLEMVYFESFTPIKIPLV